MEKKRTTLRSQTVQCPHCGEYYSVTYAHCPFCSEGRREAEEEKSASFLGSLFGGKKTDGKKTGKNREKQGERTGKPRHEEPKAQKTSRKSAASRDGHRSGSRKKISEMTPEERAAFDEDRRIRAEQRKKERERKAREEARLASSGMIDIDIEGPTETGTAPAAPRKDKEETGGEMEQEVILIQPKPESAPATESMPVEVPVEVSVEAPVETPAEESVEVEASVEASAEPSVESPVQEEAPAAETVSESPVEESVQEEVAAPAEPVPKPDSVADSSVEKIESDEDLDALLNEIRQMISRSPVPTLSQEQIAAKVTAPPLEELVDALLPQTEVPTPEAESVEPEPVVPEVSQEPESVPSEQPAEPEPVVSEKSEETAEPESPAPVLEETAPAASEESEAAPTAEKLEAPAESSEEPQEALPETAEQEEPDQQPEVENNVFIPGGPLPFGDVGEEDAAISVATKKKHSVRDSWEKQGKKERRKEKKAGKPPILLLLSLAIVIIAAIILVKCIVPTFQTGILSGGETAATTDVQAVEGGAQTFTLDRTEATMTEKGASITLVPTFTPDGSTGVLTWASSDPAIATVSEAGLVTSVAPGVVTVTASLANGQTATCTVTCDWQLEQGPTLSAGAVTLDGQGKTVQITVNGAAGIPTWVCDKPGVATVTADGTVTAIAKGTATVTATVDGKDLTCKVDCIW